MDCKYYATIVITGISVSIIKLSKHIWKEYTEIRAMKQVYNINIRVRME
jgi:hypothetical protein